MYTIISGTNRDESNTEKIAKQYVELLRKRGVDCNYLSLKGLNVIKRDKEFDSIEKNVLIPTQKFIFISPEYNGSIPGVLKAMIDMTDIRKVWWGKKALLTGVSTGRAGNLRGMEHLTGILNYLKIFVHPNKLPISVVDKLISSEGVIVDKPTLQLIEMQLDEFINF
ncbi:MAG TPA: NAD(P)H-dependent oxidoreductase [Chitinophagaceae bacterium]|nr:NAD(P)H-dependent oxidoreductase [Chitinophagaceae bacterium]